MMSDWKLEVADVSGDISAVDEVHVAAARNIVGYGVVWTGLYPQRQRRLDELFEAEPEEAPRAALVLALRDEDRAVGGVVLETPDPSDVPAADDDREQRALLWVLHHRVLSALFIDNDYRRSDLGRQLLVTASRMALRNSVRYIDGFVDERNPSVGFYQRVGAQVMPHNVGLPPRPPALIDLQHVPGVNGNWFRFDLWQLLTDEIACSRCSTPLRFDARADYLACDTCGPPPQRSTD